MKVKARYKLEGMSCASCASSSQRVLCRMKGISTAEVNYANAGVMVEYDTEAVTFEQMQTKLERLGFSLLPDTDALRAEAQQKQAARYKQLRRKLLVGAGLTVPLVGLAMFGAELPFARWWMLALAFLVVSWTGREFFVKAWQQAKARNANMDTLVAVGTGAAMMFSLFNTLLPNVLAQRSLTPHLYYETAAVVIVLILLGRFLEERAKRRTSQAIENLLQLRPQTAWVWDGNAYAPKRAALLAVGDRLLVKPSEQLPTDGRVVRGASAVDESMLTGEAMPVAKTEGSAVFGGTMNGQGSLEVIAEAVGSRTVLAGIIRLLEQAQGSRAPVQQLVDKVAAVFVPTVMAIAALSFGIWWMAADVVQAFHIAIAVLIIACPCALGLATPTAIMVGIGNAATKGILIKNAESLERIRELDVIVLDKTGTLTQGKPTVQGVFWQPAADGHFAAIKSIEQRSEHPLAQAVTAYFSDIVSTALVVTGFESVAGRGVRAQCDGAAYWIGNEMFVQGESGAFLPPEALAFAQAGADAGQSAVWISTTGQFLGVMCVADALKPDSLQAIQSLQARGLEVHLLTGDTPRAAEAVAKAVGIVHWLAGCMPADKQDYIKRLQAAGKRVGMVGDGTNDAPALAQADVSVAMGTGTAVAIESADIALVQGGLTKLGTAISLSAATVRTIRQNLFWAFFYNVLAIPVAAGALYPATGFLLDPMLAGAAMSFSSVSVVANSLRLRRA